MKKRIEIVSTGKKLIPMSTSMLLHHISKEASKDTVIVPAAIHEDVYYFDLKQIIRTYGDENAISQDTMETLIAFILKQAEAYGTLEADKNRGQLNLIPNLDIPELTPMIATLGKDAVEALYSQAMNYVLRQFANQGLAPSLIREEVSSTQLAKEFLNDSEKASISMTAVEQALRCVQESYGSFVKNTSLTILTTTTSSSISSNSILRKIKRLILIMQRSMGASVQISRYDVERALRQTVFGVKPLFVSKYHMNGRIREVKSLAEKFSTINDVPKVAFQEYFLSLIRLIQGTNNWQSISHKWAAVLNLLPLAADTPAFPDTIGVNSSLLHPVTQNHIAVCQDLFLRLLCNNIISICLDPIQDVFLNKLSSLIDARIIDKNFVPSVSLRENTAVLSAFYNAFTKSVTDFKAFIDKDICWPWEAQWKVDLNDKWFQRSVDFVKTNFIRHDHPRHLYDAAGFLGTADVVGDISALAGSESNRNIGVGDVNVLIDDDLYNAEDPKWAYDEAADEYFTYYLKPLIASSGGTPTMFDFPYGVRPRTLARKSFSALKHKYIVAAPPKFLNPFPSYLDEYWRFVKPSQLASLKLFQWFYEHGYLDYRFYARLRDIAIERHMPLSLVESLWPKFKEGTDTLQVVTYAGPDVCFVIWDPSTFPIYEYSDAQYQRDIEPAHVCWPGGVRMVETMEVKYSDEWYLSKAHGFKKGNEPQTQEIQPTSSNADGGNADTYPSEDNIAEGATSAQETIDTVDAVMDNVKSTTQEAADAAEVIDKNLKTKKKGKKSKDSDTSSKQ